MKKLNKKEKEIIKRAIEEYMRYEIALNLYNEFITEKQAKKEEKKIEKIKQKLNL